MFQEPNFDSRVFQHSVHLSHQEFVSIYSSPSKETEILTCYGILTVRKIKEFRFLSAILQVIFSDLNSIDEMEVTDCSWQRTFLRLMINSFFSSSVGATNVCSRSAVVNSIANDDCWRLSLRVGAKLTVFTSRNNKSSFFLGASFVFSPNRMRCIDGCGSLF